MLNISWTKIGEATRVVSEIKKKCCIKEVWVVDLIRKIGYLINLETFLRLRILKIRFVTKTCAHSESRARLNI